MENIAALWTHYHNLVKEGKAAEARIVMMQIQNFQGNPRPKTGCGSCSRRFR